MHQLDVVFNIYDASKYGIKTSPDTLMNASVLSAVRLRGNVVHNTTEADILSKTGFWQLALVRNIRGRAAKSQTVINKCGEMGCG